MRTWKGSVISRIPRVVTTWVFSITLPPPPTDIPKGNIFRLSHYVLILDHDAFLGCEVLPNAEGDMFDMDSRQVDLRIHAVEANPREQVRIHDTEIRSSEEMTLGLGLRDNGTIDVVKVESHHIFLWKI